MPSSTLFLKLSDLLLYTLYIKTSAGISQLEKKKYFALTSPREYLWIFLLNQGLNHTPSMQTLHTLTRSSFWAWQIVFHLKRYFKEKSNRQGPLSFKNLTSVPLLWQRTAFEEGDKTGSAKSDIKQFYQSFIQEIKQSQQLSPIEEKKFLNYTKRQFKKIYQSWQKQMRLGFDFYSFADTLQLYCQTYVQLGEFFAHLYLALNQIKNPKRQKFAFDFIKNLTIIGAAHDDISDLKGDIDPRGKLREPNLFACLLTPDQKRSIASHHQGKFSFTSMDDAKKSYPSAYKQIQKFIKQYLYKIKLVSGINIHELIHFYLYSFPAYYLKPTASDSPTKKTYAISSVSLLALQKENRDFIRKFKITVLSQTFTKQQLNKMYLDLVAFVYAGELHQSGYSLTDISRTVDKPVSTISRWSRRISRPASLRGLSRSNPLDYSHLYYLFGAFIYKGSLSSGRLKMSSSNIDLLQKLNILLNPGSNCIFQNKRYFYFSYYKSRLSQQLKEMKNSPEAFLEKASSLEQDQFVQGLLLAKAHKKKSHSLLTLRKNRLSTNIKKYLLNYFHSKSYDFNIKTKGLYYHIAINNRKNRLGEMQTQENLIKYQKFAKHIILNYFGFQSKEFWDEFPGLFYICYREAENKFRQKSLPSSRFMGFLKYQTMAFFKNFFQAKSRNKTTLYPTLLLEGFFADEHDASKIVLGQDKHKLSQALNKLQNTAPDYYWAVVLRFGLLDNKQHTLTGDLPIRLYDLGVKNKQNKTLSKQQTYRLLSTGLNKLQKYYNDDRKRAAITSFS